VIEIDSDGNENSQIVILMTIPLLSRYYRTYKLLAMTFGGDYSGLYVFSLFHSPSA
jgi:hypothetical protein